MKALENVKVLDLTVALSGPFCTQILAAQGAEVITIDPPGGGYQAKLFATTPIDLQRMMNGSLFANKKGVTINLKSDKGRDLVLKLAETADVVVSNFSPGTMDKLGLSYEEIHKINPRAVYCVISGFGQNGPLKNRPAYDLIIQAMTGLMSLNGYADRDPMPLPGAIGDIAAAIYAAFGIMAALHARDTLTGEGQFVDKVYTPSLWCIELYQREGIFYETRAENYLFTSKGAGCCRVRGSRFSYVLGGSQP